MDFAKRRLSLAESLYYSVLEKITKNEIQRLSESQDLSVSDGLRVGGGVSYFHPELKIPYKAENYLLTTCPSPPQTCHWEMSIFHTFSLPMLKITVKHWFMVWVVESTWIPKWVWLPWNIYLSLILLPLFYLIHCHHPTPPPSPHWTIIVWICNHVFVAKYKMLSHFAIKLIHAFAFPLTGLTRSRNISQLFVCLLSGDYHLCLQFTEVRTNSTNKPTGNLELMAIF